MTYNPNEPRDKKERWTTDGFADVFYPKTQLPGPVGPKGPANALSRNDADRCRQLSVVRGNAQLELDSRRRQLMEANRTLQAAMADHENAFKRLAIAIGALGGNTGMDCLKGALDGFRIGGEAGALRGCGIGALSPSRIPELAEFYAAVRNAFGIDQVCEDATRNWHFLAKSVDDADAALQAAEQALRDGGCTA